ncbi:glutamate--tRNA ligase [Psychroflexus gondwanensis]|jgi:glutamyl-tRNA synthetase|uniref:glutamate--tRNA ligase n=1 Tax=Psychroflexus gondwanensis TaxID=251 RepID=UPI0011BFA07F|nr:glutamate--tRNA ligase [Psychroflexus gondwanensis]TXE17001.1 glutamate--tRNA ligase [Psychroflexus gondwanensis]
MDTKVRVRFAPSPTGPLHIGGVRTALYNYLFAKKHQGDFLLRIEDTDQNRFVEGAEEYIKETLEWCGIPFDEGPGKPGDCGPYKQSERKDIYGEYVDKLIQSNNAYYAFDTPEDLDAQRKEAEQHNTKFSYGPKNRNQLNNSLTLSVEELQTKLDNKEDYVIRFKTKSAMTLSIHDEIRGFIEVDSEVLDDKILFKSDGLPTYHLANIVDDHLMRITHVIRGEEWLPSLPLHVSLYEAFGWETPKFAHLPLILKPSGKGKLSKRDGDQLGFPVFPIEWKDPKTGAISSGYREEGFFPETLVNMLALLGWNDGTEKEFFSIKELTEHFELERVHKSGAKFDPEKTEWFQHHYMQEMPVSKLVQEFSTILKDKGVDTQHAYVKEVVETIRERATFVSEFWELSSFYFESPKEFDSKSAKKAWKNDSEEWMRALIGKLESIEDFSQSNVQSEVKEWINTQGLGFGKIMQPLRLALVGAMRGPDAFHIASCIGKEETISRLNFAIEKLA